MLEKEQAEQDKLQNVNFDEKKSTRKWNGTKSCVQGDKQIKKWKKGSGDLRAGSHPAKWKETKEKLRARCGGHTFNPNTGKAEDG